MRLGRDINLAKSCILSPLCLRLHPIPTALFLLPLSHLRPDTQYPPANPISSSPCHIVQLARDMLSSQAGLPLTFISHFRGSSCLLNQIAICRPCADVFTSLSLLPSLHSHSDRCISDPFNVVLLVLHLLFFCYHIRFRHRSHRQYISRCKI
jgi:hypothetical protein